MSHLILKNIFLLIWWRNTLMVHCSPSLKHTHTRSLLKLVYNLPLSLSPSEAQTHGAADLQWSDWVTGPAHIHTDGATFHTTNTHWVQAAWAIHLHRPRTCPSCLSLRINLSDKRLLLLLSDTVKLLICSVSHVPNISSIKSIKHSTRGHKHHWQVTGLQIQAHTWTADHTHSCTCW